MKWSDDCWFLSGLTASGKTDVGIALARMIDAEIVSLDSMTIYRGMDIGTAKPRVVATCDGTAPSNRYLRADRGVQPCQLLRRGGGKCAPNRTARQAGAICRRYATVSQGAAPRRRYRTTRRLGLPQTGARRGRTSWSGGSASSTAAGRSSVGKSVATWRCAADHSSARSLQADGVSPLVTRKCILRKLNQPPAARCLCSAGPAKFCIIESQAVWTPCLPRG